MIARRFLIGVVMVAAIVIAAAKICTVAMSLGKVEYGETVAASVAVRWSSEPVSGSWLSELPVTSSPYGPLYPSAVRAVASAVWPPLLAARVVSLSALVLTAAILAAATIGRSQSASRAALAAILFATAPVTRMWGHLGRPDMLSTCLVVASYAFVASARWPFVVASAACLVAVGLTRQVSLLHVVAIASFVGFRAKSIRHGVAYTALVAAGSAVSWAVLNWWSGGFWLESAWLVNAGNEWRSRSVVDVVFPFLRTAYGAIALGTAWWLLATKGPRESMRDVWLVATLASFGIGVLLAGKAGGGGNYLLETTACAAVLLAVQLPEILSPRPWLRPWMTGVLGLGLTLNLGLGLPRMLPRPQLHRIAHVRQLVAGLPPSVPILADGELVPDIVAVGRTPVVNDSWFLRLLEQRRGDLQTRLVADLDGGRIPIVLFVRPLAVQHSYVGTAVQYWPGEVLDVLARKYAEEVLPSGIIVLRWHGAFESSARRTDAAGKRIAIARRPLPYDVVSLTEVAPAD